MFTPTTKDEWLGIIPVEDERGVYQRQKRVHRERDEKRQREAQSKLSVEKLEALRAKDRVRKLIKRKIDSKVLKKILMPNRRKKRVRYWQNAKNNIQEEKNRNKNKKNSSHQPSSLSYQ